MLPRADAQWTEEDPACVVLVGPAPGHATCRSHRAPRLTRGRHRGDSEAPSHHIDTWWLSDRATERPSDRRDRRATHPRVAGDPSRLLSGVTRLQAIHPRGHDYDDRPCRDDPHDLPRRRSRRGAFVIPFPAEGWPVVRHPAGAAGLDRPAEAVSGQRPDAGSALARSPRVGGGAKPAAGRVPPPWRAPCGGGDACRGSVDTLVPGRAAMGATNEERRGRARPGRFTRSFGRPGAVTCAGAYDPIPRYRLVRIAWCPACVSWGDTSPTDDPIRKRHQDL